MSGLKARLRNRLWPALEAVGLRQKRRRADEDPALAVPFSYPVPPPNLAQNRVAAVCHVFHPDLTGELMEAIAHVEGPVNAYFSTDTEGKRATILALLPAMPNVQVEVRVLPNRGRDIAPKMVGFADVYDRHELILFLHSKKSAHHANEGRAWRRYLFRVLAGSRETVRAVLEIFEQHPEIGVVMPQHLPELRPWLAWMDTYKLSRGLAKRMGLRLQRRKVIDFPAGAMFWVRSAALKPLLHLRLTLADFPDEGGQVGATTAHAVERLYLFAAEMAGFGWVKVGDAEGVTDTPLVQVHTREELGDFLRHQQLSLLKRHGNAVRSTTFSHT